MTNPNSFSPPIDDPDCDENPAKQLPLVNLATPQVKPKQNKVAFYAVLSVARPRHWVKNLLLFVPIVLTGHLGEYEKTKQVTIAFILYCALASSVYVINDIIDLAHDRAHPVKRLRPFASGILRPSVGLPLGITTTLLVLLLGFFSSPALFLGLLVYSVASFLYSLWLKRIAIVDTLLLASFFVWRLFVGASVAHLPLSNWLFLVSMLLFLSISLAKRFSELRLPSQDPEKAIAGRGYRPKDKNAVLLLGIFAGALSALVFAEYLKEGAFSATNLSSPEFLWICFGTMVLWLSRLWGLCLRGQLQEDPVEFTLNDPSSRALVAISGIAVLLALVV